MRSPRAKPLSTSTAHVWGPQSPSTTRPRCSWKTRTAAAVAGPNSPGSSAAQSRPSAARRRCKSLTASPDSPRCSAVVLTVRRRTAPSGDVLGEVLEELTLALRADQPLHGLTVVEDQQRRDAHDVEPHRGLRVVVDVELGDGQPALVLRGDLDQRRADHLAGPAPLGPEIDDD